jgi:solute carrier family 25 phosphate transporter 23/24/25/41
LPLADGIAHIEEVFQQLDAEHDNKLDAANLHSAFQVLELPCTEKDVETLLESRKHEKLTREEFTLFCLLKEFQLRQVFDLVDADGNGFISLQEFTTGMHRLGWNASSATMKDIFYELDSLEGTTGELTYLEWRSLVIRCPGVMRNIADEFHTNRLTQFDVGGFNLQASKPRDLSAVINLLAGFVAGSFSRTLTAPAERVKTEMQLAAGKPPGVAVLCRQLFADGGARAFFQGNLANCLKVAPQSALFFLSIDFFKKTLPTRGSPQYADIHSFMAGSLAGMTSQFLIYPLEPIKTCLTVAPKGRFSGIIDCGRQMIATRGWSGLYSGVWPTVFGCIPYSGVQFLVYDALQRSYIKRYNNNHKASFGVTFLCGLVSSSVGMTVSYPLMVVRTRLQVQGMCRNQPLLYSGVSDCFQKIWRQDGARGLMKGVVPNLLKAAPAAAVNLAMYEQTKNFLLQNSPGRG